MKLYLRCEWCGLLLDTDMKVNEPRIRMEALVSLLRRFAPHAPHERAELWVEGAERHVALIAINREMWLEDSNLPWTN